jgi:hypothetical protein
VIGLVQQIRVKGGQGDGQTFPGPPLELRRGTDVYRLSVDDNGHLLYAERSTLPATSGPLKARTIAGDLKSSRARPRVRRPGRIHPPLTEGERRAVLVDAFEVWRHDV